jgi:hypothetical protein
MSRGEKVAVWIAVIGVIAGGSAAVVLHHRLKPSKTLILQGTVIRQASQADKESPLANVAITSTGGLQAASCKSDTLGYFMLAVPISNQPGPPPVLQFRHPGFRPLDLEIAGGDRLYVARMAPLAQQPEASPPGPQVAVTNISVRYSVRMTTAINVGSSVKTFQVVNTGNVPCNHHGACSPDGKWNAANASITLDAGEGNVFRNARVSCIAGPCPFTRITPQTFPSDVRILKAAALDWSDTATFLVEAEIFHPMESAEVRKSYPVIFGRVLDFTLPASAEGVCIEADVGGDAIVFPLGPDPVLQWAECRARVSPNKTQVYRCELTPDYRF